MIALRRGLLLGWGLTLASCSGGVLDVQGTPGGEPDDLATAPDGAPGNSPPGAPPPSAAMLPEARLRRLTLSQYASSVRELLQVEPDVSQLTPLPPLNGLRALAASTLSLAERDVERFHQLADSLSEQAFSNEAGRQKLTGCDARQAACAEGYLDTFAARAFRRPLSSDEGTRYVALLRKATQATGDGWLGLRVAISALLQSPHLLYRAELGEPEAGKTSRRLTDHELAARLSYFLWNSTPDVKLQEAAQRGELATAEGVRREAKRLLADPRAAVATEELFSDYLQLDALDALTKLPATYPQATATLPVALRQETLRTLRTLLFERGGDFRDVFTSRTTFVDAELAKLYGVRAPSGGGFGEIELPADGPRQGLLLQGSFLALHAHPSRSSPTLRGKFMRESLLCQSIPPPPNDVETTLPDTGGASTARQKLAAHRENPSCAGCHAIMDPMGLGLENFDGIGVYRKTDNGLPIDASGELDGETFGDALGLTRAVRNHPDLVSCFAKTVLRYARGSLEQRSEEASLDALAARFAELGYRVPDLMLEIASDPSFRYVGAVL